MTETLEQIRRRYFPAAGIRILLLGESPPHGGQRFFYKANSTLFQQVSIVLVPKCGWPRRPDDFLQRFSEEGWFLDDFLSQPGGKPEEADPKELSDSIQRLSELISQHHPIVVVGVLLSLSPYIEAAIRASAAPDTSSRILRFPHHSDDVAKLTFRSQLRAVVAEVGCSRDRHE